MYCNHSVSVITTQFQKLTIFPSYVFVFSAEELGIKELVPAYLDPHLQPTDLPTGVSFASGATGFDPETPRLVVFTIFLSKLHFASLYNYISSSNLTDPSVHLPSK